MSEMNYVISSAAIAVTIIALWFSVRAIWLALKLHGADYENYSKIERSADAKSAIFSSTEVCDKVLWEHDEKEHLTTISDVTTLSDATRLYMAHYPYTCSGSDPPAPRLRDCSGCGATFQYEDQRCEYCGRVNR